MGRKKPTQWDLERMLAEAARVGPVGEFVEARIKGRRGDEKLAIAAAAKHFSKDEREIRRRRKAYRDNPVARLYPSGQRLAANLFSTNIPKGLLPPLTEIQFILRWIPIAELEQLEPAGPQAHAVLLRIAQDREDLDRLRRSEALRRGRPYQMTSKASMTKNRRAGPK